MYLMIQLWDDEWLILKIMMHVILLTSEDLSSRDRWSVPSSGRVQKLLAFRAEPLSLGPKAPDDGIIASFSDQDV